MTEVTTSVNEKEWKSFLDSCDAASIYHTPEWKSFLEKTYGYEPHYLFAKDDNDNITGMLPLFYVKSKLTGNRLCSVPFSHTCGPIGDGQFFSALINESINIFDDSEAKFIEIRNSIKPKDFETINSYSTYILDVSKNVDEIWRNLSSNARRAIGKSKKNGLHVRATNDRSDLKMFYDINCMTKKKIGAPCHPWNHFKNLIDIFEGNISLYVVEYNEEIIAGGIREYYHDTIIAGYAAANPNYVNLNPYNALNWKTIEDASSSGFNYYDMGRVSYDNKGLMFFKSRWGTTEKKLYYSFYPKNPMLLADNRDNFKYRIGTKIIRKMPISIYQKFSDRIFGSFG